MDFETIIEKISRQGIPGLSSIIGCTRIGLLGSPEVNERILSEAETSVFKSSNIPITASTRDDLQRTLAQYLCQRNMRSNGAARFAEDVFFSLAIPVLLVRCLWHTARQKFSFRADAASTEVVSFLPRSSYREVVGAILKTNSLVFVERPSAYLGFAEFAFVFEAVRCVPRFLWYPRLICNLLRWLSNYGYLRRHYRPKVIVNFFEATAASSAITAYLNEYGIAHVNVMHGEDFHQAANSFYRFNIAFVWGRYFADLMIGKRCPSSQFIACGSPLHRRLFQLRDRPFLVRDRRLLILYSTLLFDAPCLASVINAVQGLDTDWSVILRPHPLHNRKVAAFARALIAAPGLEWLASSLTIEDSTQTSLESSLALTTVAVSVASMAMLEAWISGCKVIYIKEGINPSALTDRYQDSENVAYFSAQTPRLAVQCFLRAPPQRNAHEEQLVRNVTYQGPYTPLSTAALLSRISTTAA